MPLKLGFGIFTGQAPAGRSVADEYAALLELAPVAEDAGFDSLWVSEHHLAGDGYLPSLLPVLAAVGARTRRIELGTAVVLAPFHHPLRLAEDAAVVDLLSGGRLSLGIGAGWREEEFRGFGVVQDARGRRVEDLVQVLRLAWAGERFSHRGRHHAFEEVLVTPAPGRRIPIWLAGTHEAALRRAGRIADGYVSTLADPETLRERVAAVDEGAREAGRDPADIALGILLDAWLGEPDDKVLSGLWRARQVYSVWRTGGDVAGAPFQLPPLGDDPPRPGICGDPDDVVRSLLAYAGVAAPERDLTFLVRLHYPGLTAEHVAPVVAGFGRDVVPALRIAAGSVSQR